MLAKITFDSLVLLKEIYGWEFDLPEVIFEVKNGTASLHRDLKNTKKFFARDARPIVKLKKCNNHSHLVAAARSFSARSQTSILDRLQTRTCKKHNFQKGKLFFDPDPERPTWLLRKKKKQGNLRFI
jgi:hypothetical protein